MFINEVKLNIGDIIWTVRKIDSEYYSQNIYWALNLQVISGKYLGKIINQLDTLQHRIQINEHTTYDISQYGRVYFTEEEAYDNIIAELNSDITDMADIKAIFVGMKNKSIDWDKAIANYQKRFTR